MIDRKLLKADARACLRGVRPSPLLVTAGVLVILAVTQLLSMNLNGDLDTLRSLAQGTYTEAVSLLGETDSRGPLVWLLVLALNLMTVLVSDGYLLYCLRLRRGKNPGFFDIFDVFALALRLLVIAIVRSLLASVVFSAYTMGALLLEGLTGPVPSAVVCLPLLIPGILLLYVYRMAEYILLDNPAFPALRCMALSRFVTAGRKGEMLLLDLSFLGWLTLCVVFFPLLIWVWPYLGTTWAGWYDTVVPRALEELRARFEAAARQMNAPGGGPAAGRSPGGWTVPGGWSVPGSPKAPGDEAEQEAGAPPEAGDPASDAPENAADYDASDAAEQGPEGGPEGEQ